MLGAPLPHIWEEAGPREHLCSLADDAPCPLAAQDVKTSAWLSD